jgi:hypothetical protein
MPIAEHDMPSLREYKTLGFIEGTKLRSTRAPCIHKLIHRVSIKLSVLFMPFKLKVRSLAVLKLLGTHQLVLDEA